MAVLDFNNSYNPLVDGFQDFALANAVVPLARSFGVGEDYEYLRPSIKRFPTGMHALSICEVHAAFASMHTGCSAYTCMYIAACLLLLHPAAIHKFGDCFWQVSLALSLDARNMPAL